MIQWRTPPLLLRRAVRPSPTIIRARFLSTRLKSHIYDAIFCRADWKRTAIVDSRSQKAFTYGQLLSDVEKETQKVQEILNHEVGYKKRIAFVAASSYEYVVSLLSIIAAQAVALPISPTLPRPEIRYMLEASASTCLFVTPEYHSKISNHLSAGPLKLPVFTIEEKEPKQNVLAEAREALRSVANVKGVRKPIRAGHDNHRPSLLLFTSGTTSRPKAAMISELNLLRQAESLNTAWRLNELDRVLHCLPLNHIHGILNGVLAPLIAGACIEFQHPFVASMVWDRLAAPFRKNGDVRDKVTVFTAVPTMYKRLLDAHEDLSAEVREASVRAISSQNLRLAMAGSAAVPKPIAENWSSVSQGNDLVERYGMTETGMIMSCGLDKANRIPGSVGWPLPGVNVRLVRDGKVVELSEEELANGLEAEGTIQVRGETVFTGYLNNDTANESAFARDEGRGPKWFDTGDVAVRRDVKDTGKDAIEPWATGPAYFILGRENTDIIKRGGEKISALEIESVLLKYNYIREAAVLGVPSEIMGETVAAVVGFDWDEYRKKYGSSFEPEDRQKFFLGQKLAIQRWLVGEIAAFKVPRRIVFLDELPRNAMGKVNKKQLASQLFPPKDEEAADAKDRTAAAVM